MTFPNYKIDPDSEVRGTGAGEYTYVTTTPDYRGPGVKKMPDHKKTYVPLHRLKKEISLKRYLRPGEFVHHENENKSDDSPSNLELKTNEDHARDHAKNHKFWKKSPRNKPGREADEINKAYYVLPISAHITHYAQLLLMANFKKNNPEHK